MPRRRPKRGSGCQGASLPDDLSTVNCVAAPTSLLDCCERIAVTESKAIYEKQTEPDRYYWLNIEADLVPLRCCALDSYMKFAVREDKRWESRKPDYLLIGWTKDGECYVVFLELRQSLINLDQLEDKREQVKQGMQLLCKNVSEVGKQFHQNDAPRVVAGVCDGVSEHKIVGVVMPIVHSKSRAIQTLPIEIAGRETVMVPLPHTLLSDCTLTWSNLLRAIGL